MEDMRECMAFEEEDWNEDMTDLVMLWLVVDDMIQRMPKPIPYWIWFIRGWLKNKHVLIQIWWRQKQCMKWQAKYDREHGNDNTGS